jgi:hypothetical protein
MNSVMKTMNGEWRLEFKLYWKTQTTARLRG